MATLYALAVFSFFLYPLGMYFMENERVPLVPVFLPFIDENTSVGYTILCSIHLIAFVAGTMGTLCCDFIIAACILNTLVFARIISLEMNEINIDLLENVKKIHIQARFRNILCMHQEMIG